MDQFQKTSKLSSDNLLLNSIKYLNSMILHEDDQENSLHMNIVCHANLQIQSDSFCLEIDHQRYMELTLHLYSLMKGNRHSGYNHKSFLHQG